MIDENGILMIEPSARTSGTPVIDTLTLKMTAAWCNRRDSDHSFRGFHICACGATSDNKNHWVHVGSNKKLLTNSLCIHYLAWHRDDIPPGELDKVRALGDGELEPTEKELARPHR